MAPSQPDDDGPVRSYGPWLGLLLVLVITLNAWGGWVRLSGSGVAIPSWPVIHLADGTRTFWPPLSEAGWQSAMAAHAADQRRLAGEVAAGRLHPANLGRSPTDLGDFRGMFLTEWSHRLLAALVGIVALVTLVRILRDPQQRPRLGPPVGLAVALIGVQAAIGGLLVSAGTSTSWLFLHQGNAGAIVCCLALACLRLVTVPGPARTSPAATMAVLAAVGVWLQMVGGALVAGSRHGEPFATDFPTMFGAWLPQLWAAGTGFLDQAVLHQFVHRWMSWGVAALVLATWVMAVRSGAGERARLSAAVAATFLGCEMVLGLANVLITAPDGGPQAALGLAHQIGATCLLIALTMTAFWLRHESAGVSEAAATAAPVPVAVTAPRGAVLQFLGDLLILMKWRITLTALFTGYVALVVEGHHHDDPAIALPVMLAMLCTGGAANTLNQIFERDRDEVMKRTRQRRPLPSGRISVRTASVFAGAQFALATAIYLLVLDSPLGALLGAVLVVYYSFFYTLWLKPRHWINIVIGGVPGAMGPPLAWAAATGSLTWAPVAMFLLIFLWTPPHVWSLAIKLREDYARVGIPMLPVVKGVDETTRQIFLYTLVLVIGSLLLPMTVPATLDSWWYLGLAMVLGAVFLVWAWVVWRRRPVLATMPLFHFSNVYIFALFIALMADAVRARGP
jgi:heme o synthase